MVVHEIVICCILYSILRTSHSMPAPFEMPINSMISYYEDRDRDAKANPIPYDSYGAPPDHYPAIIPDMSQLSPGYYDENSTYPGIYDNNECHSVQNCPWELQNSEHSSDPYAPIFLGPGFLGFGMNPDEDRVWKCNVEVDCFAQQKIPEDLSNDTEVLFLRSFNFTKLEIGNLSVLPPLIKLRIEYSDLRTIEPGSFASQPTLEILELEGNDIDSIQPSTFLELRELTNLDLSNNRIHRLSRNMFSGLEALTELSVGSNALTHLNDFAFAEMSNLEELTIDDNNITYISTYAFSGMPKLKRLYLNHNKLGSVPTAALREPPTLVNLHLTGNPLQRILRADFIGLEKLETLWLDECGLVSIGRRTFHNTKLKMLVLSDNYLTKVPNLGTMRRLQTVRLEHNPWNCDCNMTRTVRWLRRQSLGPQSQDPECATPPHFEGKRVLELSNDDLCSPPPKYFPRLEPRNGVIDRNMPAKFPKWYPYPRGDEAPVYVPTTIRYGQSQRTFTNEDDDDDAPLPEGGWSKLPYDTDKIYSTNRVQEPIEPLPTFMETSTETTSTATELSSVASTTTEIVTSTQGAVAQSTTRAEIRRETTSSSPRAFTKEQTTDGNAIKITTEDADQYSTVTTKKLNPPKDLGTPLSVTIVLGLVAAVIIAIISFFGVFCVLHRYQEKKAEKKNTRAIELRSNSSNGALRNGSSSKVPEVNGTTENGRVVNSKEGT